MQIIPPICSGSLRWQSFDVSSYSAYAALFFTFFSPLFFLSFSFSLRFLFRAHASPPSLHSATHTQPDSCSLSLPQAHTVVPRINKTFCNNAKCHFCIIENATYASTPRRFTRARGREREKYAFPTEIALSLSLSALLANLFFFSHFFPFISYNRNVNLIFQLKTELVTTCRPVARRRTIPLPRSSTFERKLRQTRSRGPQNEHYYFQ